MLGFLKKTNQKLMNYSKRKSKIQIELDFLTQENKKLQMAINNLHDKQIELTRLHFANFAAIARYINPPGNNAIKVLSPLSAYNYEKTLISLQKKYPKAFPLWHNLMKEAVAVYLADPKSNLSVSGNATAEHFSTFIAFHARGRVLDIGCGVARLPLYLENYPLWAIAGIDPEEPEVEHPFLFVQGLGESIPWPNQSFETVIIATSLDHALSLDDTLREISRVLTSDGKLLIWVGFIPGAKPYDPFAHDLVPIDKYHLFHFDMPWFEKLMDKFFICLEKMNIDNESYFYSYAVKPIIELTKNEE